MNQFGLSCSWFAYKSNEPLSFANRGQNALIRLFINSVGVKEAAIRGKPTLKNSRVELNALGKELVPSRRPGSGRTDQKRRSLRPGGRHVGRLYARTPL